MEVERPQHLLSGGQRGAPDGNTLLKRRLLGLLGYRVVRVPYFEWPRCHDAKDTYLRHVALIGKNKIIKNQASKL